uniref:Uncharacterized protein n=1 Tax=Oryza glumipatula TaxID=40148 RepID=A0A0E0AQ02_9ORYZ
MEHALQSLGQRVVAAVRLQVDLPSDSVLGWTGSCGMRAPVAIPPAELMKPRGCLPLPCSQAPRVHSHTKPWTSSTTTTDLAIVGRYAKPKLKAVHITFLKLTVILSLLFQPWCN